MKKKVILSSLSLFVILSLGTSFILADAQRGIRRYTGVPGDNLRNPLPPIGRRPSPLPRYRPPVGYGIRNSGKLIEICPTHTCSSTNAYSPNPIGVYADLGDNPTFVLKVSQYNVTGTSPSATVVIESSPDKQAWMPIAVPNFTGTGTFYIPLSTIQPISTQIYPGITPLNEIGTPGSGWSGNWVNQYPTFGKCFRAECNVLPGSTGSFQFQVLVMPGSHNNLR